MRLTKYHKFNNMLIVKIKIFLNFINNIDSFLKSTLNSYFYLYMDG